MVIYVSTYNCYCFWLLTVQLTNYFPSPTEDSCEFTPSMRQIPHFKWRTHIVGSAPSLQQTLIVPSVAGKFGKQVGSFQVVDWKWKDLTLSFPVQKNPKNNNLKTKNCHLSMKQDSLFCFVMLRSLKSWHFMLCSWYLCRGAPICFESV
jgi:hypothetical protein